MRVQQRYQLKRAVSYVDDYGQQRKDTYSTIATLPISIYLQTDKEIADNPLFNNVSYVGIYKGSWTNWQKLDMLDDDYRIVRFLRHGRSTYLFLEEVN